MPAKVSVLRLLVLACIRTCGGRAEKQRGLNPNQGVREGFLKALDPVTRGLPLASRTLGFRVLISSMTVVQFRGLPKSPLAKTMRCVGPLPALPLPLALALALVLVLVLA